MITGIHHAAMRTADFDKAVKFYGEGLGLKQCFAAGEGKERMALFAAGDSFIEIFADGEDKTHGAVEHFALASNNVDADFQLALAAGATERVAPKDVKIPGEGSLTSELDLRIAFVTAPTGEMIEFFLCR